MEPRPNILVVDNYSTDDSVAQILKYFPSTKILKASNNLGFGGGCNLGMNLAIANKADYIWLLNNDAIANETTLSELVSLAERKPQVGAVGSVVYEMNDPTLIQVWGGGRVNLISGRAHLIKTPGFVDFLSGASLLIRCSTIKEIGGFDDKKFFMYWEDADLSFRMRNAGWMLDVAENSKVWHKLSASLGKGNPRIDQMFICSAIRFFRAYAPLPKLAIASLLTSFIIKRIMLCRWRNIKAVVLGAIEA